MGLSPIAMKAETGPIGGDLSHEFIIISKTGESDVFFDESLLKMQKLFDEIEYNDNLQKCIDKYTSFYAATDEMHNPKETQNIFGKLSFGNWDQKPFGQYHQYTVRQNSLELNYSSFLANIKYLNWYFLPYLGIFIIIFAKMYLLKNQKIVFLFVITYFFFVNFNVYFKFIIFKN